MRRGAPIRRPAVPAAMSGEGSARARRAEQEAMRAWVRMLTVHKRALAILREHLERDMTLPRFDLLAHLARGDGQTLAALAKRMLVTSGNLTGLVDRAARDGMVERRADPRDRRAWQVHLTAKGQRAFRETERRHATRVSKLFDDFSREELSVLSHLLDKLKTGIHEKPPPTRARGAAPLRARATPSQTSERSKRRRP